LGELAFDTTLRLTDSKHYQSVFDNAEFKVSSKHALFLSRNNQYSKPRLGLVIAKKNVKLATQRNRIKRVLRESFRLKQHTLPHIDIVVLVRKGIDRLDNQALFSQFNRLWSDLEKKSQATTQTDSSSRASKQC